MKTKKETPKWMKFGCLGVIILFTIPFFIYLFSGADNKDSDHAISAYIVSKEIVKSQLMYPEEADFALLPVLAEMQEGTDSLYRVVGDVTIKNAFGVKSKIRYMVRMKYVGGNDINPGSWKLIDYSIPGID